MGIWQIGAAANGAVALVYLAIAVIIAPPLWREGQRQTLGSARQIISDLLGETGSETALGPGQLVRQAPALVGPDEPAG